MELTYPNTVTTRGKYLILVILLLINAAVCVAYYQLITIIVTLVGALTSPMVIFIIPGYLFYDYAGKNEASKIHKRLSLAMTVVGVFLLLMMTTISFYVLRIDRYPDLEWLPSKGDL